MPIITGTTYKIINTDTHNVLESHGAPHHTVNLAPWNNGNAQKWVATIQPGTQNSWFLRNVDTGLFLGVAGNVPANPVLKTETNDDLLARFDNSPIEGLDAQNAWFIPPLPTVGEFAYKIHYKDPHQPPNHGFEVEGGGFVTITDVSAGDLHRPGKIIQLFFDSNTPTQVWNFELA